MTSEAQRKINDDLIALGIWLSANKLSANLVKTEYMILATSTKLNPILDGGGGKFAPLAGFLNIAQKPLGLGS